MAERYRKRLDRLYGVVTELMEKHGVPHEAAPVQNVLKQIEVLESLISKREEETAETEQREVEREAEALADVGRAGLDFKVNPDKTFTTGGIAIGDRPERYHVGPDGEYVFHDDYLLGPGQLQERAGEAPVWDHGPEPNGPAGVFPCPCGCGREVSSAHFVPEQVVNHEGHGVSAVHEFPGCGTVAVLPLSQLAENDPARFEKLAENSLVVRDLLDTYGKE